MVKNNTYRLVATVILFVIQLTLLKAQNNSPQQVMYIYNFTKYIKWDLPIGQSEFRIGTLGADSNMIKELKKLVITVKKIHSLPVRIIPFGTLKDVKQVEVLYIDFSEFRGLKVSQFDRQTLIVTANNPDLNNTMIAFFKEDQKFRFAINTINITKAGLNYNPDLVPLAATALTGNDKEKDKLAAHDWLDVFGKFEMAKNTDQKEITVSAEEINEVLKRIESQKKTLADKEIELDILWKKIASKEKALEEQNLKIQEQIRQIMNQEQLLKKQNYKLRDQDEKIINQGFDIELQAGRLKRQEQELLFNMRRNQQQQRDLLNKQQEARQLANNILKQRKTLENYEGKINRQLEKINLQKLSLYIALSAIVIVLFLSIIIYRNLIKNRTQNKIITLQKDLVEKQKIKVERQKAIIEEKNTEMLKSINYARRIQASLLASEKLLSENLPSYFHLYLPKDVVSGDFYWGARLENNEFAIVIADSTGHGVPGAIMSMLNIACLNEAVVSKKLVEPSEILNQARSSIIKYLSTDGSSEGGKDGMDCSLLVFNFTAMRLKYAGANNPVWIVRNSEVFELFPDKMPIGRHDKDNISFRQQQFDLEKNDMIYAFTDGFPDQFGGPEGKKFMHRKLKALLQRISTLAVEEQRKSLAAAFAEWMGNEEQVDDVCMVGVKIT